MKRSLLMFGLSIITAIGAGGVATSVLVAVGQQETVVFATRNLKPYTQIEPGDVKTMTISKDSGITGIATKKSDVVGHYLSFAVPKGYPITQGDLDSTRSFSSFLTQYVERTGKPGMLLPLSVQSPLAQVVDAGESIALIVPHQTAGGTVYQTIEPVPVLNVLQPAKGGAPTALLVFVTEQDYNTLAPAILSNNVQVGLIPQNGSFTAPQAIQLPAGLPASKVGAQSAGTNKNLATVTSNPPPPNVASSGPKKPGGSSTNSTGNEGGK